MKTVNDVWAALKELRRGGSDPREDGTVLVCHPLALADFLVREYHGGHAAISRNAETGEWSVFGMPVVADVDDDPVGGLRFAGPFGSAEPASEPAFVRGGSRAAAPGKV